MLEVIIILLEVISRLVEMVAGYTTRESVMPMTGFTLSLVVLLCSLAASLRSMITDSRNAVYDLNGVMVRQPGESLSGLKPGVYITRDKKIIIK